MKHFAEDVLRLKRIRSTAVFSGELYRLPKNIDSTAALAELFQGSQVRGVLVTHDIGDPESIARDVEQHLQGVFCGQFSVTTRRFALGGTTVRTVCLMAA